MRGNPAPTEMGIERGGGTTQNPEVTMKSMEEVAPEGFVGQGLQIWGDVKFKADAVVTGAIRGRVEGMEKVILSPGSTVAGSVRGSDIRVEGEVQGGVEAKGKVWLGPKSRVKVRCRGRSVRIEPGAEFNGELQVG